MGRETAMMKVIMMTGSEGDHARVSISSNHGCILSFRGRSRGVAVVLKIILEL